MATITVRYSHVVNGVHVNPTSVKLSDPTGAFGIKRLDTDAVVVADDTPMVNDSAGIYHYTFAEPAPSLTYLRYVEVVYAGETYHFPVTFSAAELLVNESFATLSQANSIADGLLHAEAWEDASDDDKIKALKVSSQAINNLRFKYYKTVDTQYLEFPRNGETTIPSEIVRATVFNAIALLEGKDPERELAGLGVTSRRFSSVGTTYGDNRAPQYLILGLASPTAWNLIRPWLSDMGSVRTHRVS